MADQLRRLHVLIERMTDELTSEALRSGKAPDQTSLDTLTRLVSLADTYDGARHRRLGWRLTVVYAAFLVLMGVGVLQLFPIPRAEVELQSQVSSVSFTLPYGDNIVDNLRLASFDATSVGCVTFTLSADAQCASKRPIEIRVAVPSNPSYKALVTIQQLHVPSGGRVTLSKPTSQALCRVSIDSPGREPIHIALSLRGVDVTTVVGTRVTRRSLPATRPPSLLELVVASPAVFEVLGRPGSDVSVQRNLHVTDLSFTDQTETKAIGGEITRPMSSIVSGALYLDSLNGKRIDLRPFDSLQFAYSDGRLRTLALTAGRETRLDLDFHGFVEGMRGGTQEAGRSLMPSTLEYVAAQSGLALYWGSVAFLFALFMSIKRFWRDEP